MPLSKARMKKRKQLDRLKARIDNAKVKPSLHNGYSANQHTQAVPVFDADGQPIPEYW